MLNMNQKYVSDFPSLMEEWNYKKNEQLKLNPSKIKKGSDKKVWWKCKEGHEWIGRVANRTKVKRTKCPVCSNRVVVKGINDLSITSPELLKEWNYEKNIGLSPFAFSRGSGVKVWWKCKEGHEWEATIVSRSCGGRNKLGSGCPICSNKVIVKGINDLSTTNPELLEEWDYEKNVNISPYEVSRGSHRIVWWKCKKGHSWKGAIYSRTYGRGCARCFAGLQTSFPEQAVFYYLKKIYHDAINRYQFQEKYEIDIFVPSLKIGIEYDGKFYHKNSKKKEEIKDGVFEQNDLTVWRIKETTALELNFNVKGNVIYYYSESNYSKLNDLIKFILKTIFHRSIDIKIDIQEDRIEILNKYKTYLLKNSLKSLYPNIVQQWNYDKNKGLDPASFSRGSNNKVWWKCKKGHEWQDTIRHRTIENRGCPVCSNRKVITGVNDIFTVMPNLSDEWNYKKNKEVNPLLLSCGSDKKVWWKCKEGHEWQARVYQRKEGRNCPKCSNKIRTINLTATKLKKNGSLLDNFPEIACEWDYNKNTILPTEILSASRYRAWWKCKKCNYEWQACVYSRKYGCGCPRCAHKVK